MKKLEYFSHIDGLRAIAVLAVLCFHVKFDFATGGFIGVDIFFVISGFLITRNILADGEKFSFRNFYLRRFRRLYPALVATVIATCLVAYAIMDGESLQALGESAIAAVISLSNVLFWMQSGYWDTSSDLKPLLHTWSLGVEEQFYLIWPAILVFAFPANKIRNQALFFIVLILFTTIVAEWALSTYPSAAFFLTPFRIGQFAIGGLLAITHTKLSERLPSLTKTGLNLAGLVLLILPIFLYTDTTRFPGLTALVPSMGIAILIALGGQGPVSSILSQSVVRYVGRASYSIYLVHWPIIVLYRYLTLEDFSGFESFALAIVSIGAGFLLHETVEKPFRHSSHGLKLNDKKFLYLISSTVGLSLLCSCLLSVGFIGSKPQIFSSEDIAILTKKEADIERLGNLKQRCEQQCLKTMDDRLNILVLGDSHGLDGFNMAVKLRPDANIMYAGMPGCDAFYTVDEFYRERQSARDKRFVGERINRCINYVNNIFENKSLFVEADLIILNYKWQPFHYAMLDNTLGFIQENSDARVVVNGQVVVLKEALQDIVRVEGLVPGDTIPDQYVRGDTWSLDSEISRIAQKYGAVFVSKTETFCPDKQCHPFVGRSLLTYDTSHLSLEASNWFAEQEFASVIGSIK